MLRLHRSAILRRTQCRAPGVIPAMFVGTGLWDSQVQYYEPAKWVAKLRTLENGFQSASVPRQHGSGARRQVRRFRRYRESPNSTRSSSGSPEVFSDSTPEGRRIFFKAAGRSQPGTILIVTAHGRTHTATGN